MTTLLYGSHIVVDVVALPVFSPHLQEHCSELHHILMNRPDVVTRSFS